MSAETETDLVRDLRDAGAIETRHCNGNPFEERTKTLHWKAADEIERLSKELEQIRLQIHG